MRNGRNMGDDHELTELQIDVMEVLWSSGEATVADVVEALRGTRDLAQTTVATLLSRLERRGIVDHRTEGRQYVYRATVSRDCVRRSMVGGLVERLFGGDAAEMLAYLMGSQGVDPADLERVKALIERQQERGEE